MKVSMTYAPLGLALLMTAGGAQAAISVYTSQASYLAAISAPGVDTYENFSITGSTPSPVVRTAGSYGYTANATPAGTFFGAGSNADRWLSTNTATDSVIFNAFTGGVRGLGGFFFGSDINGQFRAGSIIVTATDASGTVSQTITGATTSSFLGFVSTGPLLSASVSAVQPTGAFLWPTINNLTLGSAAVAPVPEPGTWAMLILGFGLLGSFMRSAKRQKPRLTYA